jgi:hypothetical protein
MVNESSTSICELKKRIGILHIGDLEGLKVVLEDVKFMITANLLKENRDVYMRELSLIYLTPSKPYYLAAADNSRASAWEDGKHQLLVLLDKINQHMECIRISRITVGSEEIRDIQGLQQFFENNPNLEENEFLIEAVRCLEIGALRSAIIMIWNLTMDHLYTYILNNPNNLDEFNQALSRNNAFRNRDFTISIKDHFNDMKESQFIENCRSANIISNDVRKILDAKLGVRNTYAHPSNVGITKAKVVDFVEDLVNNILLKFSI